jgi:hypothetical protein
MLTLAALRHLTARIKLSPAQPSSFLDMHVESLYPFLLTAFLSCKQVRTIRMKTTYPSTPPLLLKDHARLSYSLTSPQSSLSCLNRGLAKCSSSSATSQYSCSSALVLVERSSSGGGGRSTLLGGEMAGCVGAKEACKLRRQLPVRAAQIQHKQHHCDEMHQKQQKREPARSAGANRHKTCGFVGRNCEDCAVVLTPRETGARQTAAQHIASHHISTSDHIKSHQKWQRLLMQCCLFHEPSEAFGFEHNELVLGRSDSHPQPTAAHFELSCRRAVVNDSDGQALPRVRVEFD